MCYCTVFALLCLILNLGAISKYKPPGACIWRGDLREGFLRYEVGGLYLEGLIHEEAYFQNFTVTLRYVRGPLCYSFKFLCSQQCTVQYRK